MLRNGAARYDLLIPDSFPNYKQILGDEIKNMELDVSTQWEVNDEYWIEEAKNLIELRESLLAIGIEEQDLQYIELKKRLSIQQRMKQLSSILLT